MNNESSHPFIESQLDTNIFIHGNITNGVKWTQRERGVGPLILKKEIVLNVVSDLSDTHMWIIGLKSVSQNQTLSNANLSFTTCDT